MSSKLSALVLAVYTTVSSAFSNFVSMPLVAPYADKLMDFVVDNRGWFTTFFILPLSFVYENVNALHRRWERFTRAASKHDERVRFVQKQIREAPKGKMLCTARPARAAMSIRFPNYKGTKYTAIDLNNLDNILSMDEEKGIVKVEPNCTMGQVTHELLPTGWTLQVTPELDSLTVGGLINGFGVETSSHKYGLFQHTCVSYEVVLPNGELVRCSQTENPELFAAIPWSHGTIGFLTAVEIKVTISGFRKEVLTEKSASERESTWNSSTFHAQIWTRSVKHSLRLRDKTPTTLWNCSCTLAPLASSWWEN
jgi:delta24-sterol reductase